MMTPQQTAEAIVDHYLGQVGKALKRAPAAHRRSVQQNLREHIAEALAVRTDGQAPTSQDVYAVLAEMDPPDRFSMDTDERQAKSAAASSRLDVVTLVCSLMQIAGLFFAIADVPVLPGIAGFAAVVNFLMAWARGRTGWLFGLAALAGVCGVGLILFDVAKAL